MYQDFEKRGVRKWRMNNPNNVSLNKINIKYKFKMITITHCIQTGDE